MFEKLKIKAIYDDFLNSIKLTEEQIKILDMLIQKEKIIKISLDIGLSERSVKYEIKKIKDLYKNYCEFQELKSKLLLK